MYKIDSFSIYSAHSMARNSGTEQIITNAQDVDREQYNGGEEGKLSRLVSLNKSDFYKEI